MAGSLTQLRISVLGAGNAGHATAGDLALAGAEVRLYELPEFARNLAAAVDRGGIEVVGDPPWRSGFARVVPTTDIAEALHDADCVFVTTVAEAHERLADLCAPHLEGGQAVVLFTAYGGSFFLRRALQRLRRDAGVLIGETTTLPYYTRLTGPARVTLWGKPYKSMGLAALPASDTEALVDRIQPIYSFVTPAASLLEVMLLNPNVLRHTTGTLLNIGRIEYARGDFWIYREGFTPSVWRVLGALDAEKQALMAALGLTPMSYLEARRRMTDYTVEEQSDMGSRGPVSADTRYLTEDVPMGLVLRSELGERLRVPMPTHRALIHLASVIAGRDYASEGRTLGRLGFGSVPGPRLREAIDGGAVEEAEH